MATYQICPDDSRFLIIKMSDCYCEVLSTRLTEAGARAWLINHLSMVNAADLRVWLESDEKTNSDKAGG